MSVGEPPQQHDKGGRRTLDALWLDYLAQGGRAGDGSNLWFSAAFKEGTDAFNNGQFFEAHELFERAWNESRYPEKLLCLALSKLGAAFEHAARGNRTGARKIVSDARRCLAPLPNTYAGMDVRALEAAVALAIGPYHGPAPRILPAGAG